MSRWFDKLRETSQASVSVNISTTTSTLLINSSLFILRYKDKIGGEEKNSASPTSPQAYKHSWRRPAQYSVVFFFSSVDS